jgi:hypothetical protein
MTTQPTEQRRLETAYRVAFGRPVTKEEVTRASEYIADARKAVQAERVAAGQQDQAAFASYLRALLASNEFLFVD